ncbi:FMN-binding protein [Cellulomonas massiliensis]|uniref:FMN-binding protein n=1 Tax=Cellulomonas massiliensis TaxID=1465811 RepID=UPI0002D30DBD|nr:FMN-binding protein [Cellulomonas massiliensis]
MRRITIWALSTLSGLVLLLAYPTSTGRPVGVDTATGGSGASASGGTSTSGPASGSATGDGSSGSSGSSDGGTSASSGSSSGSSGSSGSDASGTFTGAVADTRWGPVQVQITVEAGRITSADAVQYPTGNPRDQQINAYAVPQLNTEVTDAQSAQIDLVSGATVTSRGYVQSLQDAIDQAFGA